MAAEPSVDGELIRRFLHDNDRDALSSLFERHRTLAFRVALGILGSRADAEDAVQDAFLNLVAYAPRVRGEGPLGSLVARMSLRAAQRLARTEGRRRARETAWAGESGDDPGVLPDPSESHLAVAVREAVQRLHDRYRLPIVLHYFQGLSTMETADALGISQTAVTTRLSRAVGKLRAHLDGEAKALPVPALVALLTVEHVEAAPATLAPRLAELAATVAAPSPAVPIAASLAQLAAGTVKAKLITAGLAVAVVTGGGAAAVRHARSTAVRSPAAVSQAAAPGARLPGGLAVTAGPAGVTGPVAVGGAAGGSVGPPGVSAPPRLSMPAGSRPPVLQPGGAMMAQAGQAPPPVATDPDTAAAEQAFREANDLAMRGLRERWPKKRFAEPLAALRKVVERWPKTEVAERAQSRVSWVMSNCLQDHAGSVHESERLLQLYPLSRLADHTLLTIYLQCRDELKDPARGRAIMDRYLASLQALAQQDAEPETQAGVLYLTGMAGRYLRTPGALDRLQEVKDRYPESRWAEQAAFWAVFREVDFVARVRLDEDIWYTSREQGVAPGSRMQKRTRRAVVVHPMTWDPDGPAGTEYTLRLSTPSPAGEAHPVTAVAARDGLSEATWRFPQDADPRWKGERALNASYALSGTSEARSTGVSITRRSKDLGGGRWRFTVMVRAPDRVHVGVQPPEGSEVLPETVSPPAETARVPGVINWEGPEQAGGVRPGLDCRVGRSFTFEAAVPPGQSVQYPGVQVSRWQAEPAKGRTAEARATFGDTTVEIASGRKHTVEWDPYLATEAYALVPIPMAGASATVLPSDAEHTQCQSNLKILGSALIQYAQAHGNRFPPAKGWRQALYPYLRDERLFHCPADRSGRRNSYAYSTDVAGRSLSDFARPTEVVAFFETASQANSPTGKVNGTVPGRHGGFANFTYVDGHVKALRAPAAAASPGAGGQNAPARAVDADISDPEEGAQLSGVVTVRADLQRHDKSLTIGLVSFHANGRKVGQACPGGTCARVKWDTRQVPDGSYSLRVHVWNYNRETKKAEEVIHVSEPVWVHVSNNGG